MVPSVARLPLQVASTYAATAGRPPPQVAQRWPAQFRKKRSRSPSAILMACVEIRRYASRPDSQSEYTVAVETLRRRAASLTVSSESAPIVTFSCITGALNVGRKSPKPGEGTENASSETSPDCEDLRDPAWFDSQCGQDWGASGRWFKSSRPDFVAPEIPQGSRGFLFVRGLRRGRFPRRQEMVQRPGQPQITFSTSPGFQVFPSAGSVGP